MTELPPTKKDEHHPLLKVHGCGGSDDVSRHKASHTPGSGFKWNVSCVKATWTDRWPELVSACWMTLILFGITFLICCGLGLGTYKLSIVPEVKTVEVTPGKDVFLLNIVKYNYVPISYYSEYLTKLVKEYRNLQFNVIFLLDDTLQYSFRKTRNGRYLKKFFQKQISDDDTVLLSENNRQELIDYQSKWPNMNITVMPLSQFMGNTPLKYKWKGLSSVSLAFYARIFSVWLNGGIGMDLSTFSYGFVSDGVLRRANAILKQHNDGKAGYYTSALNSIDQEESDQLFSDMFGIIGQVFKETNSFFSPFFFKLPSEIDQHSNNTLIHSHRNKREVSGKINDTVEAKTDTITSANMTSFFFLNISSTTEVINNPDVHQPSNLKYGKPNATEITISEKKAKTNASNESTKAVEDHLYHSKPVVMFYDILFSQPSNVPSMLHTSDVPADPELPKKQENEDMARNNVLLDNDGYFVATAWPLHSFLDSLISASCQRGTPRCLIKNIMLTQCASSHKGSNNCKNVFII